MTPDKQDLLSPYGRFYLVAVEQNDVPGICRHMLQDHGLQSQVSSMIMELVGKFPT